MSMTDTALNVGDTIKCLNAEEMVNLMYNLHAEGIETDFMYEKDREKGLWLKVTEVKHGRKRTDRKVLETEGRNS